MAAEPGKAEAAAPMGASGRTDEVPRTIALGAAASSAQAPVTQRHRLGRRQSGFDEVEAAIAALQSSIQQQGPAAANAVLAAPAIETDLPAVVRDRAIAARAELAHRRGNDVNSYRPLSDAGPLDDDPFPPNRDFEDELRTNRLAAGIGWVAFAAMLVGLGAFAWLDRVAVVRALPGSAAAYAMLGAQVNARGLEFSSVDAQWQTDGRGRAVLSLTGRVKNVTQQPQSVPTVVFAFEDQDGRELFDWATPVRASDLPPGETLPFTTVVPAPPDAVRNIEIRFAKARR